MITKLLFIIPCYNEAQNIGRVVEELKTEFNNADILVVNDASKDNSIEILKTLPIAFLDLPFNLGYAGALQAGFKYAVDNKYDTVVQFDGDGQHIPSEAKKLLEIFEQGNLDIVIGSRFLLNTGYKHGLLRTMGTKIFTYLIQFICKEKITDPTSGFQMLRTPIFTRYSKMYNFPDYPDANLLIEMILEGYKIKEIPVKMRLREFGVSMHSGFWRPVQYMVQMFYSIFMITINFGFKRLYKK